MVNIAASVYFVDMRSRLRMGNKWFPFGKLIHFCPIINLAWWYPMIIVDSANYRLLISKFINIGSESFEAKKYAGATEEWGKKKK